jgi:hypothetical protein
MKLVKSLILGSTAGVLAVAGAQAADLPSRKAAPVEYVRICDAFGTGYFYIPGTDTCLRIGGRVRAEYRWTSQQNQYAPIIGLAGVPVGSGGGIFYNIGGTPQVAAGAGVLPAVGFGGVAFSPGYLVNPTKFQDRSGFRARGRIELDARTQTAWGTLRTFFRFEIDYNGGKYVNATAPINGGGTFDNNEVPYIDKAFIQFAGITAGKAQSMFDFYADNYGYQDIRGSDASINLLAYTATFGGGFSATISLEDSTQRRAGILAGGVPFGSVAGVLTPVAFPTGLLGTYAGAAYNGQTWPDVVGVLRVDQPWGAAQLSAAVHNQNSSALFNYTPGTFGFAFGPTGVAGVSGGGYNGGSSNSVGYAIQGGVQIKLPMLAAGDDLWIQATYARGSLDYQQVGAQEFGRYPNGNGWRGCFVGPFTNAGGNGCDGESVFYIDNNGIVHHTEPTSWSVLAAINHYWTPTFATSLRASYLNVSYGNGSRFPWSGPVLPAVGGVATSVTTAGNVGLATNWSEWRVAINPEWYPVKGLTFGFELMYVHLNQKAPLVSGFGGTVLPYGGSLVGGPAGVTAIGAKTWNNNANGWEARLRVQRDF